jgi:hypothetical protein
VVVSWGRAVLFVHAALLAVGVGSPEELGPHQNRLPQGTRCVSCLVCGGVCGVGSDLACTLCMITSTALLRLSAVLTRALPGALHVSGGVCAVLSCSGLAVYCWQGSRF